MTPEETIEWTYRLHEALGIGRNQKRAESEANEWLERIKTEEQKLAE